MSRNYVLTSDVATDHPRTWAALDWAVRTALPMWLDAAGITAPMGAIGELEPIVDQATARAAHGAMAATQAAVTEAGDWLDIPVRAVPEVAMELARRCDAGMWEIYVTDSTRCVYWGPERAMSGAMGLVWDRERRVGRSLAACEEISQRVARSWQTYMPDAPEVQMRLVPTT